MGDCEQKAISLAQTLIFCMDLCYICYVTGDIDSSQELYDGAKNAVILLLCVYEESFPEVLTKDLIGLEKIELKGLWSKVEDLGVEITNINVARGHISLMRREFMKIWEQYRTKRFNQSYPFKLSFKEVPRILRMVYDLSSELDKAHSFFLNSREARAFIIAEGIQYQSRLEEARLNSWDSLDGVFKVYSTKGSDESYKAMKDLLALTDDIKLMQRLAIYTKHQSAEFGHGIHAGLFFPRMGTIYRKSFEIVNEMNECEFAILRGLDLLYDSMFEQIFVLVNFFEKQLLQKPDGKIHKTLFNEYYRKRVYPIVFGNIFCAILESESKYRRTDGVNLFVLTGLLTRFHMGLMVTTYDMCAFYRFIEKLSTSTNADKITILNGMTDPEKKVLARYKEIANIVHGVPQETPVFVQSTELQKIVDEYRADDLKVAIDFNKIRARLLKDMPCSEFEVKDVEVSIEKERKFERFVCQGSASNLALNTESCGTDIIPDFAEDLEEVLRHHLEL